MKENREAVRRERKKVRIRRRMKEEGVEKMKGYCQHLMWRGTAGRFYVCHQR